MTDIKQQLRKFLSQPASKWTIETAQRVHGVVLPPGTTNLQVLEAIFGPTKEIPDE